MVFGEIVLAAGVYIVATLWENSEKLLKESDAKWEKRNRKVNDNSKHGDRTVATAISTIVVEHGDEEESSQGGGSSKGGRSKSSISTKSALSLSSSSAQNDHPLPLAIYDPKEQQQQQRQQQQQQQRQQQHEVLGGASEQAEQQALPQIENPRAEESSPQPHQDETSSTTPNPKEEVTESAQQKIEQEQVTSVSQVQQESKATHEEEAVEEKDNNSTLSFSSSSTESRSDPPLLLSIYESKKSISEQQKEEEEEEEEDQQQQQQQHSESVNQNAELTENPINKLSQSQSEVHQQQHEEAENAPGLTSQQVQPQHEEPEETFQQLHQDETPSAIQTSNEEVSEPIQQEIQQQHVTHVPQMKQEFKVIEEEAKLPVQQVPHELAASPPPPSTPVFRNRRKSSIRKSIQKAERREAFVLTMELIKINSVTGPFAVAIPLSKIRPFFEIDRVCLEQADEKGRPITEFVFRSDYIVNNDNPEWEPVMLDAEYICKNNRDQPIIIRLMDFKDCGNHAYIGQIETTLNELLNSSSADADDYVDSSNVVKLKKSGKTSAKIVVTSAYIAKVLPPKKAFGGFLKLNLKGEGLKTVGDVLSKSDPFFEVSRIDKNSGEPILIYRSPYVKNDLWSEWEECKIRVDELFVDGKDQIIRFDVYGYESNGSHEFMGGFETTMARLVEACETDAPFGVMSRKGEPSGSIFVTMVDMNLDIIYFL